MTDDRDVGIDLKHRIESGFERRVELGASHPGRMLIGGGGDASSIGVRDGREDDRDGRGHILSGIERRLSSRSAGGHDQVNPFVDELLGDGVQGGNVAFGVAANDGQVFTFYVATFGQCVDEGLLHHFQRWHGSDHHHADGNIAFSHCFISWLIGLLRFICGFGRIGCFSTAVRRTVC